MTKRLDIKHGTWKHAPKPEPAPVATDSHNYLHIVDSALFTGEFAVRAKEEYAITTKQMDELVNALKEKLKDAPPQKFFPYQSKMVAAFYQPFVPYEVNERELAQRYFRLGFTVKPLKWSNLRGVIGSLLDGV